MLRQISATQPGGEMAATSPFHMPNELTRSMEPHSALAIAWLRNEYLTIAYPSHMGARAHVEARQSLQTKDGTLEFWCDVAGLDYDEVYALFCDVLEYGA